MGSALTVGNNSSSLEALFTLQGVAEAFGLLGESSSVPTSFPLQHHL
jgi:hypothetical protein